MGHGGLCRGGYYCCWVSFPLSSLTSSSSLTSLGAGADQMNSWLDQVRFFQIAKNKMVQGSLSNMTWTEAFVGPVSL